MDNHGFPVICAEAPAISGVAAAQDEPGAPPWRSPHLVPSSGRAVRVRMQVLVPPSRETAIDLAAMRSEPEIVEVVGRWAGHLDCWRAPRAGPVLGWRELTDAERAVLAHYNHDEER